MGASRSTTTAPSARIRPIVLGRRNYLFAGSDAGGERAANIYSLIGTAMLNAMDPYLYLRHVLERIAEHPINRIDGTAAMERRRKRCPRQLARRPSRQVASLAGDPRRRRSLARLAHIQALIEGGGQIMIGTVAPIRGAAVAHDGKKTLVMLRRRPGEAIHDAAGSPRCRDRHREIDRLARRRDQRRHRRTGATSSDVIARPSIRPRHDAYVPSELHWISYLL